MASGGGASVRVKRIVKKGLRSIERSSKLLSHERCSVSRPGSERSGNRVHPRAHRRPSQGKPSRAVVEAVYGVAMGATERRTVRRDRSRASAQPSPLVSNRASGAAVPVLDAVSPEQTGCGGAGLDPAAGTSVNASASGVSSGPAHGTGGCVQRAHRDPPLLGLQAAGGSAPEVPGFEPRASGGLRVVFISATPLGGPGPFHRLVV